MTVRSITLASLFLISACGNADMVAVDTPEPGNQETPVAEEPEEAPKQPFLFEVQGQFIQGLMSVGLKPLPSGNWLIITRDGHVILQNSIFQNKAHDLIPVETYWDAGLLSVALDPDFATNHFAYFYSTSTDTGAPCDVVFCNVVSRFKINEESPYLLEDETILLTIPGVNRAGQHNGGGMGFGPDGKLYVATGQGGFYDAEDLAQDPNSMLGKVLAVDPAGIEAPEIVAMGLRNPFTAVAVPGGLAIGDVGAVAFEEIDFFPFGSTSLNFGWPAAEGPSDISGLTDPILALRHCDSTRADEDPGQHTKNHNGVLHDCFGTAITVAGYYPVHASDPYAGALNNTLIYSEIYSGIVRGVSLDGTRDRHLAHLQGLTAIEVGLDGFLYGVSIFEAGHVVKLVPNPE